MQKKNDPRLERKKSTSSESRQAIVNCSRILERCCSDRCSREYIILKSTGLLFTEPIRPYTSNRRIDTTIMAMRTRDPNVLVAVGKTTYFSASSASGRSPDGTQYHFLPSLSPSLHDTDAEIHFSRPKNCLTCHETLVFPYNISDSDSSLDSSSMFYVALREAPDNDFYNDEDYRYQWTLTLTHSPFKWKWEWLEIGWQFHGKAVLPLGDWDVLQCDTMEFSTSGSGGTYSGGTLVLQNATVGAFLDEGFVVEELKVYSPCSGTGGSCRILNNEIYCQEFGWPAKETWEILPGLIITLMVILWSLRCCLNRGCRAARQYSKSRIDGASGVDTYQEVIQEDGDVELSVDATRHVTIARALV